MAQASSSVTRSLLHTDNSSAFRSSGSVSARVTRFSSGSTNRSSLFLKPFTRKSSPTAIPSSKLSTKNVNEVKEKDLIHSISRTHGQVVQVLNPEVRLMTELADEVAELNQDLLDAQSKVDLSEEALNSTLDEMEALQRQLDSLGVSMEPEISSLSTLSPFIETARPSIPASLSKTSTTDRTNGLKSTLHIEPELKYFWYPIEFTAKLNENTLIPLDLFGKSWVLFRDAAGKASCLMDECAHRACPLSLGSVSEGQVACAYHGWKFDGAGACTEMPSSPMCSGVNVQSLPIEEKDGFIFIWAGEDREPDLNIPDLRPPEGYTIHSEITMEVPVEHGLLIENLLDLAHAPFTHTATFARGWPIPEVVRFHLLEKFGGNWDPYPIDMSFLPPVMTISKIGLNQPGKIERGIRCEECKKHLHQLHVNLPAKEGHTRLLYRMSLDFMGWVRFVPGIQKVWKEVANQVLGEDLTLVTGQQDRMMQGRNTWNFPVPYDKLAVRYRRWRNNLAQTNGQQLRADVVTMSAGDLFLKDEE
mmetsp:Transcript_32524/g.45104  ORF Transcript_32524/g.45104 Transcript_32524/m.45104 type:complete len:531 (-) Transcript_32524:231-1823(-)|eukprot:CAMPEP_0196584318 /NCGR_PEP_ID=MMETSP1081-20130531/46626_1 /TAXON_ID=36882 /ORGANISM="Pyramimonas amylifera, Strain CCMP720" /LENGTH=530 /DNA_ID=CAMNT_0041905485 /DNA_START=124 /DNA_END=1716 /DNA_ORIENTATION=+